MAEKGLNLFDEYTDVHHCPFMKKSVPLLPRGRVKCTHLAL